MLEVIQRTYANEFYGITTSYPLGNVGDEITESIIFDVFWKESINTTTNAVTVSDDGTFGYIERTNGSWLDAEFAVGDRVYFEYTISSTTYNFTANIVSIPTSKRLILDSFGTPGDAQGTFNATGNSDITTVNFFFNLIENSEAENYQSKIDNGALKMNASGLLTTDSSWTNFEFTNSISSYFITGARIRGKGLQVGAKQRFEIQVFYVIAPYFDTLTGLQNKTQPEYFEANNALTDVFAIQALLNNTNINSQKGETELSTIQIGNTGWYDENYNGSLSDYSVTSIAYEDVATTNAQDQFNVRNDTKVTIRINSSSGSFVNNQTPFKVQFFYIPQNDNQYQLNENTYKNNLYLDEGYQGLIRKVGNTAIDSSDYIIRGYGMTDIEAVFVDSNNIDVIFTYKVNTTITNLVDGFDDDNRNYAIIVSLQDHTLPLEASNRVTLLAEVNEFSVSVDDASLFSGSTELYEHPNDIGTLPYGDYKGWIEDGIVTVTDFYVDITKDTTLRSVEVIIKAENNLTGEDFELENFEFPVTTFPFTDTYEIDYDSGRGFKLKEDSQFELLSLKRDSASDTGNLRYYTLTYPFKIRYEDWIKLLTANTSFFDSAKENNGLNDDWVNYSMIGNWDVKFTVRTACRSNEGTTDFEIVSTVDIFDYALDNALPVKFTGQIETFDGAQSLGVDNNAQIMSDKLTTIKATFTSPNIISLAEGDMYGIIELEPLETGIFKIDQLSSMRESADNNLLIPLAGETFTKLTKVDDFNVTLECDINFILLQDSSYKISARLGSKTGGSFSVQSKTTEAGLTKTTEAGLTKTLE